MDNISSKDTRIYQQTPTGLKHRVLAQWSEDGARYIATITKSASGEIFSWLGTVKDFWKEFRLATR